MKHLFAIAAVLVLVITGCGTTHPTPEEAASNEKMLASARVILTSIEKQEAIARDFVRAGNYSLWPSPDPVATASKAIADMQGDAELLRTPLADFEAAVLGNNWNVTLAKKERLKTALVAVRDRMKRMEVAPGTPAG